MKNYSIWVWMTLASTFFSFDLPEGWIKAGSSPKSYEMGIERGTGRDGQNTATIKSTAKKIHGFGTLMQQCNPDKYLGKRVRMTAYMKTSNVTGWAGIWFRVDGTGNKTLSFDNLHDGKKDRSVKGSTEWNKYEIVLDVPLHATNLAFGALLVGTGQIWFSSIAFEVVDTLVEVTDKSKNYMPLSEPTNLNFEK